MFHFVYLPSYALLRVTLCVIISFFFFRSKGTTVFCKFGYVFFDKKTVLKILLNLGLNLTIFQGSGPRLRDTFSGQIRLAFLELLAHVV